MNLDNFEYYIDAKIITRGSDYFENHCVNTIKETKKNLYEMEVEGTELYFVEVELDDEKNIISTQCDCPYDMGAYCKYQVAAFFALREMKTMDDHKQTDVLKTTRNSEVEDKASGSAKKKNHGIEHILFRRTKEELIAFLLDAAGENMEIKQRIEWELDTTNDDDEIKKSLELIRTFIDKYADWDGFISYRDTYEAIQGADMVLKKAQTAVQQKKFLHALDLNLCVVHELMDQLDYCDDSDGIVGTTIMESLTLIKEMVDEENFSPDIKEKFFEKILHEAANKRYDGWDDWRFELLETCSALANSSSLQNKLEACLQSMLNDVKGDSWSTKYFYEKIFQIRYNLILQNEGEKQALNFVEQNLHFASFRKMAIERTMQKKNYDKVIKLALDGEELDKGLSGLVNDWRKYRYTAYKRSGKMDEQRALAIGFILDGNFEYYRDLKKTYNSQEWVDIYPKLITKMEEQKKTHSTVYTQILIVEGEKNKLLVYVQKNPSVVERYYKYLLPEFKKEVCSIFLIYIEQMAARARNRRDYQGVCSIIQNLKKAGGKEETSKIKQMLRLKYANRPAFKDELTNV
ncbi:SWIM zinc finger family protein [Anaerosinus massiliensis]|uniref:SWIM zinc finger family protein n=1 Tax=Massilibacillus massiliensis TaxID=1806837 RepID=UPI0018FEBABC|nr:hypothetical protein [Massilibacillus massiliensis]